MFLTRTVVKFRRIQTNRKKFLHSEKSLLHFSKMQRVSTYHSRKTKEYHLICPADPLSEDPESALILPICLKNPLKQIKNILYKIFFQITFTFRGNLISIMIKSYASLLFIRSGRRMSHFELPTVLLHSQ
jgi:hypothetical protein